MPIVNLPTICPRCLKTPPPDSIEGLVVTVCSTCEWHDKQVAAIAQELSRHEFEHFEALAEGDDECMCPGCIALENELLASESTLNRDLEMAEAQRGWEVRRDLQDVPR